MMDNYALFTEAAKLVESNLFVDAIKKYEEFAKAYPNDELADDALFNAGLCYFHIHLFSNAIKVFSDVIENYPDADINISEGREFGKTSAKCHYAIINCLIGIGDIDGAQAQVKNLENHPDSYVYTDLGEKITYLELGEKAIKSYTQITTI